MDKINKTSQTKTKQAHAILSSRLVSLGLPVFFAVFLLLIGATHADLWGWLVPDLLRSIPGLGANDLMGVPGTTMGAPPAPDQSWMGASLAALLFVVMLAALAYVLGGTLGARVTAWGKHMLYQSAKSALILTFIFVSFHLANDTGSIYHVGAIQINSAYNFAQVVRNTISYEFLSMTIMTALLSTVGNITPYLRPAGIIGFSFSLAPFFRPIFDFLGIMLSLMAVSLGEWAVQTWLLTFIQTSMLRLFLPMALLMRGFGFDKAGNALIAIVIGFFFVYPFMLNVNAYAVNQYMTGQFGTDQTAQDVLGIRHSYDECVSASQQAGQSAICMFKLQLLEPLNYLINTIKQNTGTSLVIMGLVQLFTGSILGTLGLSFMVFYALSLLKVAAFYILVVSVIMPLFNLFITLTVIKELAQFLGTQLDFSAFEKLL